MDWLLDFDENEGEIRHLYEELFNIYPPLRYVVQPADFPLHLREYAICQVCFRISERFSYRQLSADFDLRMTLWDEYCEVPFEIWKQQEDNQE